MSEVERLRQTIEDLRAYRVCGPSDDPDAQTNVTVGYKYLLTQLQWLVRGLVPTSLVGGLSEIIIDTQDIYTVYDAQAQVDALIPDIEEALATPCQDERAFVDVVLDGLRSLLHAKTRDDLVARLARMRLDIDVGGEYGSQWDTLDAAAVFQGPIEDCESLRGLSESDHELILGLLRELYPPRPGGGDISHLTFIVDPGRPTLIELHDTGIKTGWDRVDRTVLEIRHQLKTAGTQEQYQSIGLACRETLISLAQAVYDPDAHPCSDGVVPSETDAKRMLDGFLEHELPGAGNKEARRHAKAALDFANKLQHDRMATYNSALMCAEATTSVVNVVAIVSGKRSG